MVLAIGIVVDDAIVVLENVERLMTERKMSAFEASVETMKEVSSAVIAIVLVLCSVFIPVAFLGGMTGILYQQFAVTVAISVVISGVVALTLTPALCAILLRGKHKKNRLFRPFNYLFAKFTRSYVHTVGFTLRHSIVGVIVGGVIIAAIVVLFRTVPGSFVPAEDQGYLIASVSLPDGATLTRTAKTADDVSAQFRKNPGVMHTVAISGYDMISSGEKSNSGTIFITMKDWAERTGEAISETVDKFTRIGMMQNDGMAFVFNPPAIMGLGTAGGFEFYLQDRLDGDAVKLGEVTQQFVAALNARPELDRVYTFYRANVPQLYIEVDESKVMSLGVSISDVYTTLQSTLGTLYVNDFNRSGRVFRVQLQAEPQYRQTPEDIGKIYVKSSTGGMIPISAFSTVKYIFGTEQMARFNGFVAAKVMGDGAAGVSSGAAIKVVEEVAKEVLPLGYQVQWTGQAYQEKAASGTAEKSLVFAVIMVFLILAAQYERWSLPLAVLMAVPFGIFGALVAAYLRNMSNDIYFQIGLVVLIGLSAKNAILIVEFAVQKVEAGKGIIEAAKEAARLRFRPIVMTSLAFVLGVFPLVKATGAGAAARQSMGTGVFGGMIAATFIATIFIPMFFKWLERGKKRNPELENNSALTVEKKEGE